MGIGEGAGADEQGPRPAFHEGCKGCCDLAEAGRLRNDHLLPKRLRRFLYIGSLGDGLRHVRADKHSHRRRPRDELAQQFQPLGPEVAGDEGHAGEVGARPVEASDEAVAHRVAAGREHDRYGGSRSLGGERSLRVGACASGDQHRWSVET